MNILSNSINIFNDRDVVAFLKLDFNSLAVQKLRDALAQNLELFEKISASRSSSSKYDTLSKTGHNSTALNYSGLVPDFNISKFLLRKRGVSHDDDLIGQSTIVMSQIANVTHWRDIKFENEEDRISKFIDFLNNDPDNQS